MLRRHQKARGARRRQAHVGQAEAINADNLIFTNKFRVHVLFHTPHAPPLFDGLPLPTSHVTSSQVSGTGMRAHDTLTVSVSFCVRGPPQRVTVSFFKFSVFIYLFFFFSRGVT